MKHRSLNAKLLLGLIIIIFFSASYSKGVGNNLSNDQINLLGSIYNYLYFKLKMQYNKDSVFVVDSLLTSPIITRNNFDSISKYKRINNYKRIYIFFNENLTVCHNIIDEKKAENISLKIDTNYYLQNTELGKQFVEYNKNTNRELSWERKALKLYLDINQCLALWEEKNSIFDLEKKINPGIIYFSIPYVNNDSVFLIQANFFSKGINIQESAKIDVFEFYFSFTKEKDEFYPMNTIIPINLYKTHPCSSPPCRKF